MANHSYVKQDLCVGTRKLWLLERRWNMDSRTGTDTEDYWNPSFRFFPSEEQNFQTWVTSHRSAIFIFHCDETACFSLEGTTKMRSWLQTHVSDFMTCNSEFKLDERSSCERSVSLWLSLKELFERSRQTQRLKGKTRIWVSYLFYIEKQKPKDPAASSAWTAAHGLFGAFLFCFSSSFWEKGGYLRHPRK